MSYDCSAWVLTLCTRKKVFRAIHSTYIGSSLSSHSTVEGEQSNMVSQQVGLSLAEGGLRALGRIFPLMVLLSFSTIASRRIQQKACAMCNNIRLPQTLRSLVSPINAENNCLIKRKAQLSRRRPCNRLYFLFRCCSFQKISNTKI